MKFSVIIPVYNEQENINSLIAHIRETGDCEIIVSDSNNKTNNIIIDERVIKVSSPKGRGIQMNTGAKSATGDALLFLHADTKLPEGWMKEAEEALETFPAGAFALHIDSAKPVFRLIERTVWLRNLITRVPYGDQAIFCTREAFDSLDGYADIPLMEDVDFMKRLKKSGIRVYLSDIPVETSARRWEREGLLYTTLRNWTIISLYTLGVSPRHLKKLYK